MKKLIRLVIVILAVILAYNFQFDIYLAEAGVIRVGESKDLNRVIDDLRPGYTLIVEPGIYRLPSWNMIGLHGTADAPITIKAKGKAVIEGFSQAFAVVKMKNVSYVNFEGFELRSSAQTLGGIDGIHISGSLSHHITLSDLNIHDVSGQGVRVAADKAYNIELIDSEIRNCESTAVVFGYPDKYIVHDSVIRGNYIHHCPKDGYRRGYYGIQVRSGSYRNIVEDNVLHDVGSHNKAAITLYYGRDHRPGNSPSEVNMVRNNILFSGRNQGIAAISDALIENNTIFNTDIGLALMAFFHNDSLEGGEVENLMVKNNSIFNCPKACVHIYDWTGAGKNVEFSNNLIYQSSNQDYAIRGDAGNGHFYDNVYYGASDIIEGTSLASDSFDFTEILSLTNDPGIDMSKSLQNSLSEAIAKVKIMPRMKKRRVVKKPVLKNNVEEVTLAEAGEVSNYAGNVDMGSQEAKIYRELIDKADGQVSLESSRSLARFIHEGTLTTEYLGAGERAGVVDSYLSAFGSLPSSEEQWQDVVKIANGRWPSQKNEKLEQEVKKTIFEELYKREPNMENANDNAAVTIIAYGLRPSNRNTKNEKQAVKTFEHIYGHSPSKALDWNIVRAIAYSGARR